MSIKDKTITLGDLLEVIDKRHTAAKYEAHEARDAEPKDADRMNCYSHVMIELSLLKAELVDMVL